MQKVEGRTPVRRFVLGDRTRSAVGFMQVVISSVIREPCNNQSMLVYGDIVVFAVSVYEYVVY
jgi:hypothetical protein